MVTVEILFGWYLEKLYAQCQERPLLSGGTFLFMIMFIPVLDFWVQTFVLLLPFLTCVHIPTICVNEKSHQDVSVKFLSCDTVLLYFLSFQKFRELFFQNQYIK